VAYLLVTEHMTEQQRASLDEELAGSGRTRRARIAAAVGGEVTR